MQCLKRCIALCLISFFMINTIMFAEGEKKIMNEYSRQNKEINVSLHEEFAILLETLGSAGYEWKVNIKDQDKIKFIKEDSQVPGNAMGTIGNTSFQFKATAPGKAIIKMQYLRPWENKIEEKLIFLINIHEQ